MVTLDASNTQNSVVTQARFEAPIANFYNKHKSARLMDAVVLPLAAVAQLFLGLLKLVTCDGFGSKCFSKAAELPNSFVNVACTQLKDLGASLKTMPLGFLTGISLIPAGLYDLVTSIKMPTSSGGETPSHQPLVEKYQPQVDRRGSGGGFRFRDNALYQVVDDRLYSSATGGAGGGGD